MDLTSKDISFFSQPNCAVAYTTLMENEPKRKRLTQSSTGLAQSPSSLKSSNQSVSNSIPVHGIYSKDTPMSMIAEKHREIRVRELEKIIREKELEEEKIKKEIELIQSGGKDKELLSRVGMKTSLKVSFGSPGSSRKPTIAVIKKKADQISSPTSSSSSLSTTNLSPSSLQKKIKIPLKKSSQKTATSSSSSAVPSSSSSNSSSTAFKLADAVAAKFASTSPTKINVVSPTMASPPPPSTLSTPTPSISSSSSSISSTKTVRPPRTINNNNNGQHYTQPSSSSTHTFNPALSTNPPTRNGTQLQTPSSSSRQTLQMQPPQPAQQTHNLPQNHPLSSRTIQGSVSSNTSQPGHSTIPTAHTLSNPNIRNSSSYPASSLPSLNPTQATTHTPRINLSLKKSTQPNSSSSLQTQNQHGVYQQQQSLPHSAHSQPPPSALSSQVCTLNISDIISFENNVMDNVCSVCMRSHPCYSVV